MKEFKVRQYRGLWLALARWRERKAMRRAIKRNQVKMLDFYKLLRP